MKMTKKDFDNSVVVKKTIIRKLGTKPALFLGYIVGECFSNRLQKDDYNLTTFDISPLRVQYDLRISVERQKTFLERFVKKGILTYNEKEVAFLVEITMNFEKYKELFC